MSRVQKAKKKGKMRRHAILFILVLLWKLGGASHLAFGFEEKDSFLGTTIATSYLTPMGPNGDPTAGLRNSGSFIIIGMFLENKLGKSPFYFELNPFWQNYTFYYQDVDSNISLKENRVPKVSDAGRIEEYIVGINLNLVYFAENAPRGFYLFAGVGPRGITYSGNLYLTHAEDRSQACADATSEGSGTLIRLNCERVDMSKTHYVAPTNYGIGWVFDGYYFSFHKRSPFRLEVDGREFEDYQYPEITIAFRR